MLIFFYDLGNVSQIVRQCRYVTKGNISGIFEKTYIFDVCDLFYMCRLSFHKVYTTGKRSCIDLILDLSLIACISRFFKVTERNMAPKKCGHDKADLCIFFLKLGVFPCYLTANACNGRVLRLQNEFLCLNENYPTDKQVTLLCVLGVVHLASNNAKLRHFQFSVSSSFRSSF